MHCGDAEAIKLQGQRELAALREENARLKYNHETLGMNRDRWQREAEEYRAHVAALVKAAQDVLETRSMVDEWDRPDTWLVALKALLDAPDLAALAREAEERERKVAYDGFQLGWTAAENRYGDKAVVQAKDAVVEAARKLEHARRTRAPTSEMARLDLGLTTALRALDAAEKQP